MASLIKKTGFGIVLIAIPLCFTAVVLRSSTPLIIDALQPQLVAYAFDHLSERDKLEIYAQIVTGVESVADTVPEPLVARVLQRNGSFVIKQADVRSNNAGMRSSSPFVTKQREVFRIVCLGDSFVFGTGGREEDRFADQMEAFYRDNGITSDGREIEVYALGLGSWTTVQEASYLISRISDYDPDVILVLTVANDITSLSGVTGKGLLTSHFSPEERHWGSGVFTNQAGGAFGVSDYSALTWDLTAESHTRWQKALTKLKRLADLQTRRENHILFSTLPAWTSERCFQEIYKHRFVRSMIDAPFLTMNFFPEEGTRLEHDNHPNRKGHEILASHYVHAMAALGWVPVPEELLPDLHSGLSLDFEVAVSAKTVEECKQGTADTLKLSMDFRSLEPRDTTAFLGGILPDRGGNDAFAGPVWASPRCGFLLRTPDENEPSSVDIDIEIPPFIELFPLHIDVFVNGRRSAGFDFGISDAGRQTLVVDADSPAPGRDAIEIVLESTTHFTTIDDPRMKSFRLIAARVAQPTHVQTAVGHLEARPYRGTSLQL